MNLFTKYDTGPLEPVEVEMEESWKKVLENEFSKPYFHALVEFLKKERNAGKTIFPPGNLIFNAFSLTPFDSVKVVLLGQDPYINQGEAQGLAFSVPKGLRTPPSLMNVYQELENDLDIQYPGHGNLEHWARQGVLLLNSALTVEVGKPNSHQGKGWEPLTNAALKALSERKRNLVFMLWGRFAQMKASHINPDWHLILNAAHPSPRAMGLFFGCRHFSKANDYLIKYGKEPIIWG